MTYYPPQKNPLEAPPSGGPAGTPPPPGMAPHPGFGAAPTPPHYQYQQHPYGPPQMPPMPPGYPPHYGAPPPPQRNWLPVIIVAAVVGLLAIGVGAVAIGSGSDSEPVRSAGSTTMALPTMAPTTTEEKTWEGAYSYSAVADACELVTADAMAFFISGPPNKREPEAKPPESYGGGELSCDSSYALTGPGPGQAVTSHVVTVEFADELTSSSSRFDSASRSLGKTGDDSGPVPGLAAGGFSSVDWYSDNHVAYYTLVAWDSNAFVKIFVLAGSDAPLTRTGLDAVFSPQIQHAFDTLRD